MALEIADSLVMMVAFGLRARKDNRTGGGPSRRRAASLPGEHAKKDRGCFPRPMQQGFDCYCRAGTAFALRARRSERPVQPPVAVLAVEAFCCCDPSADFAFAPVHANAAPLAIAKVTAAAMLSNRLDIGSPPFCENRHMPW